VPLVSLSRIAGVSPSQFCYRAASGGSRGRASEGRISQRGAIAAPTHSVGWFPRIGRTLSAVSNRRAVTAGGCRGCGRERGRQAVQQADQADGPFRHAACLRKLRAGPARSLSPALYGLRMNYGSERSVSRLRWVTLAGGFGQPAGAAPRAPFEWRHAQRPCPRKLPSAVPRAGYEVSGKKVAGPISTRVQGGTIGRRLLRDASMGARGPKVVQPSPQSKSGTVPSNKPIKLTVRFVTQLACASCAPARPAAYRQRYTHSEKRP